MMSIFSNDSLRQSAETYRDSKKDFADRWLHARPLFPTIHPDKFWAMQQLFTPVVSMYVRNHRSVEATCEEFFRLRAIGEITPTFDDMLGFVNYWEDLSDALYKSCGDIITDRGDDGYGDLMDNLPLLSRASVRSILEGKFKEANDIRYATLEDYDQCPKMLSFIWGGENYFAMHLNSAAKKWYELSIDENPKPVEPRLA